MTPAPTKPVCAICLSGDQEGEVPCDATTPCGHKFHQICINEWLEKNNSCPICRREIPWSSRSFSSKVSYYKDPCLDVALLTAGIAITGLSFIPAFSSHLNHSSNSNATAFGPSFWAYMIGSGIQTVAGFRIANRFDIELRAIFIAISIANVILAVGTHNLESIARSLDILP